MVPSTCTNGPIKNIDTLTKPKFGVIVVYTRFMLEKYIREKKDGFFCFSTTSKEIIL